MSSAEITTQTSWLDIVTILLALYAALLATGLGIYKAVSELRARRPKIKVEIFSVFYHEDLGRSSREKVWIEASNPGEKAVTLVRAGFMWGDNECFHLSRGGVRFPHELSPESACSVWMDTRKLAAFFAEEFDLAGTIRLAGLYDDAVGRTHKSRKTFEFDVDRYT